MSHSDLPHSPHWDAHELEAYAEDCLLHRDASLADVINHCRGQLCYLATPYSKIACSDDGEWDSNLSRDSALRAAQWAGLLTLEGLTAVSPIIQAVEMVHADLITQQLDPLDVSFWESWCRPLLNASRCVLVPPILGWDNSDGIWGEVCAALRRQRPVFLIKPRFVEEF